RRVLFRSGYITPALKRRNGVSFRLSSRSASTQVVRFFNGETKIMTSSDLVMEGVELMLIGLGTVFVFLMMLVGLINLMSFVINRFFPDAAPVVAKPKRMAAASSGSHPVDAELLAVIGAAVSQHRARRRG